MSPTVLISKSAGGLEESDEATTFRRSRTHYERQLDRDLQVTLKNPAINNYEPSDTAQEGVEREAPGASTEGVARKDAIFSLESKFALPSYHQQFLIEQMWEGIVTEVGTDCFVAKLVDFNTGEEDEAEIPVTDVSDDDRELLAPGGGFYFSIGYLEGATGSVRRCAQLRFKREPSWTPDEILDAYREAQRETKRLNIE